jgi:Pyridoxal phosphate biosynthesis protein
MIALAERLQPYQVTIVPERREEVTTEGGLNVTADPVRLERNLARLRAAGIRTSLFIDPDDESVHRSRDLGAESVELHTGRYAHASNDPSTVKALRDAARIGASLGIAVHAGHGLTTSNVGPVAAIPEIEELNIGHHVVARAVFVGLTQAIHELRAAMDAARGPL